MSGTESPSARLMEEQAASSAVQVATHMQFYGLVDEFNTNLVAASSTETQQQEQEPQKEQQQLNVLVVASAMRLLSYLDRALQVPNKGGKQKRGLDDAAAAVSPCVRESVLQKVRGDTLRKLKSFAAATEPNAASSNSPSSSSSSGVSSSRDLHLPDFAQVVVLSSNVFDLFENERSKSTPNWLQEFADSQAMDRVDTAFQQKRNQYFTELQNSSLSSSSSSSSSFAATVALRSHDGSSSALASVGKIPSFCTEDIGLSQGSADAITAHQFYQQARSLSDGNNSLPTSVNPQYASLQQHGNAANGPTHHVSKKQVLNSGQLRERKVRYGREARAANDEDNRGWNTNGNQRPAVNASLRARRTAAQEQNNDAQPGVPANSFMTGRDKYVIDEAKNAKRGAPRRGGGAGLSRRGNGNASALGGGVKRKFVSPVAPEDEIGGNAPSFVKRALQGPSDENMDDMDPRLKACDPKLVEMIQNEIMDHSPGVMWNDIAGLEYQKSAVKEIVVWPLVRPDLFQGLRGQTKGLLLFGPPGTGKTLIGKAIASEAKAQFFSISASSLTSKWHGEGEKLVRTLFAVAAVNQPAVIFIDEIDSLLSQRSDSENEASRRIKTEFLVQLDGAASHAEDRVLIVGATNRPQELDEAARRRLVKKLYIPLPEANARKDLIENLLSKENHGLTSEEVCEIVQKTAGYSGADLRALCTEAAFGPLRSVRDISSLAADDVRPILCKDFRNGLAQVRASVSDKDLELYENWNRTFGSFSQPTEQDSPSKISSSP